MSDPVVAFAGIGFLAGCAFVVAWLLRLPAILFLLLTGLAVGPGFGLLNPDQLLGDLLFPLVSLSVAVILFEGSLTLRFADLRDMGGPVRNLVTVGTLICWILTSLIVWQIVGFSIQIALLFGAVVVVTGPTVIVPMLRSVRPNRDIANVLRWEGIIIDPLGALLAVLVFDFFISAHAGGAWQSVIELFLRMLFVGGILGAVAGLLLGEILRRYLLPDYLRSPITLLLVFVVFALAESLSHESGLLAVTVFGIVLANLSDVEVDDILDFKETLSLLLIGGLFILLAARVQVSGFTALGWQAVVVLLGVMLLSRPVAVFVSLIGSSLDWRERTLVAWIGPRGIVCAAVAAIFALKLEALQVTGAELFVPLAFTIIIGTVLIQSLTAKSVAHVLGVRDPAPAGFLIIGANPISLMLARALTAQQLRVTVADANWAALAPLRMAGVETYYGNPVSEHADRYLDLSGIGNLICVSGSTDRDVVAALYFRGTSLNIYEIPTDQVGRQSSKHRTAGRLRGTRPFSADMTLESLTALIDGGAELKVTAITDTFTLDSYRDRYTGDGLVLFQQEASGRLRVVENQYALEVEPGTRLIGLVATDEITNE